MARELEDMLFQGETIEEEFLLSRARVAVTSHRVLAFAPEGNGRRFDHADLPNVRDARVQVSGDDRYRNWMLRGLLYGVGLTTGGYLLDTSEILQSTGDVDVSANPAVGGALELVDTITTALSLLAVGLLVAGVLALVAAAALAALYTRTRRRELVVDLAGRDPIRIPAAEGEGERAAATIKALRAS